MAEVKVLVEGSHKKIDNTKLSIGSTATLIKSNKTIIVDPGYFADEKKLLNALKEEKLSADDIDLIFITHLHIDHLANIHLFKNSKLILKLRGTYPGQIHTLNGGYLERIDLFDGTKIANDVSVLQTPGHTDDMLSLVVDTTDGKVVIAGDAFPSEAFIDLSKEPDKGLADDIEMFNKSRQKILNIADYIIPGHGAKFGVKK